jgi:hypothetical protein
MAGIITNFSTLALKINGVSFPIKRPRWWVGVKSNTRPFFAYKKYISLTKTNIDLGLKGNGPTNQTGVAILISDKVGIKSKLEETKTSLHSNKGRNQSRWNTTVNIYAPNISASNFIKQTLLDLKWQIDPNPMIVEDFNTSHTRIFIALILPNWNLPNIHQITI